MRQTIYSLAIAFLAALAGFGVGRLTKSCPGTALVSGRGVAVAPTPGRLVNLAKRTVAEKVARREVKPVSEFKHKTADSTAWGEGFQVTMRKGLLSVFVPDTAGFREVQFQMRRAAFDAVVSDSGVVRVVEDRCWVCEPRLEVEAGALVSAGDPMARPYLGGDASVAVLRPWNRLFVRTELEAGDARLYLGARLRL